MPPFSYYVSGTPHPVVLGTSLWRAALPLNRHGATSSDGTDGVPPLCQGEYFQAAQSVLERNHCAALLQAVSCRLGRAVRLEEVGEVRVTLMKHGAFYHPARVEVVGFHRSLFFVLNVAVSDAGSRTLQEEHRALERLSRIGDKTYVPRVYERAEPLALGGRRLAMFLGDWFDGFHEFHLSPDPVEGREKICVWDEAGGVFFLDEAQTRSLYRKAACILTYYYNPLTFEQIFPWHHAAGDFVLRVDPGGLRLRLITVRGYAPMFRGVQLPLAGEARLAQVMAGLLIFLLNLSLRMRIDRLDGTGALAWAAGDALVPVWEGFLAGLAGKDALGRETAGDPVGAFRAYLSGIPLSEAIELAVAAAGGFHPQAAERTLLERHMAAHVTALWQLIGHGR
jgi:hypothetical protein